MAGRFQRNLGDIPEKTVARLGNPLPADTTTADLISTVGAVAGDIRKEGLKAEAREAAEAFIGDVEAFNNPEVDNATAKFEKLKLAEGQGTLTRGQIMIQAEKLIKEIASTAPGFADEVREAGFKILGFDPTGEATKARLGITTRTGKTALEKLNEEIEANAFLLGITNAESRNLLASATRSQLLVQAEEANTMIGKKDGSELANALSHNTASGMMAALGDMKLKMKNGLLNPLDQNALMGEIDQFAFQRERDIRRKFHEQGLQNSPALKQAISDLGSQMQQYRGAVERGSLALLLTTELKASTETLALYGHELLPEMVAISAALGPQMGAEYMKMLKGSRSQKSKDLMLRMSGMGALVGNEAELSRVSRERLHRVLGVPQVDQRTGTGGIIPGPAVTRQDQNVEDILVKGMTQSGNKDQSQAAWDYLAGQGKSVKTMSFYDNREAKVNAPSGAVTHIKGEFGPSVRAAKQMLAEFMQDRPDVTLQVMADGTIKFKADTQLGGGAGNVGSFQLPTDFHSNLRRMEMYGRVSGVWSQELKINPDKWLERQVGDLNEVIPEEVKEKEETTDSTLSVDLVYNPLTNELE